MTLEYGGWVGKDGKRKRPSKVPIPGGPGARKQSANPDHYPTPPAEAVDPDVITSEDLKEMSNIDGENRGTSHPDDLAVLHEMSWVDRNLGYDDRKGAGEPPKSGTQFDRLVRDAADPESTAYWNGKKPPHLTERERNEVLNQDAVTEAERIEQQFDKRKATERVQYLDEHTDRQESKDILRNGLMWILRRGRGRRHEDKRRKRGGSNA